MSKASQFTCDHDGLFRYPWYHDDVIKWKHFLRYCIIVIKWSERCKMLFKCCSNGAVKCVHSSPWWRHQTETLSALLALCAGDSPVTGEFRSQRPVTQSFDIFFDLHLNKRLSKQWRCWWFEMPSCSLWRHCNDTLIIGTSGLCHVSMNLSHCIAISFVYSEACSGQQKGNHALY